MATTYANEFRRFPRDIRLEIFQYCVDKSFFKWRGQMPSLIKALRGDPELYHDALREFHKANHRYRLSGRNGWGFGHMTKYTIATIGKVTIVISPKLFPRRSERRSGDLRTNERATPTEFQANRPPRHEAFSDPRYVNIDRLRASASRLANVHCVKISSRHEYLEVFRRQAPEETTVVGSDIWEVLQGFTKLRHVVIGRSIARVSPWLYRIEMCDLTREGEILLGAPFCRKELQLATLARTTCLAEKGTFLKEVVDYRGVSQPQLEPTKRTVSGLHIVLRASHLFLTSYVCWVLDTLLVQVLGH